MFTCASALCCLVVYFNWHRFGPDDSTSTFIIAIWLSRVCLLIRYNLKLFYHLLDKYYLAADFRYCSDFFSRFTKIYLYRCNNKLRRYCWADSWRPLEVEGKLSWCYALCTSLWQYSGTIFFPCPFTSVFGLVSNWLTGVIWRSLKRTIPVINNVTPDTLPVWSAMMDSKLAPKCLKVQNRCAF